MAKRCCGTCECSEWDKELKSYICDNKDSENYGIETQYGESCIDYMEREM